jgi:hypothetical protein
MPAADVLKELTTLMNPPLLHPSKYKPVQTPQKTTQNTTNFLSNKIMLKLTLT